MGVETNQNDSVSDALVDDVDAYMNDTSHVDDVAGLVSPPPEELQGAAISIEEEQDLKDNFANVDFEKEAAAKKIQDIANKKKEREEAKKVVHELKVKKAEEWRKSK